MGKREKVKCVLNLFFRIFFGKGERGRGEERSLSYREAKTEEGIEGVCFLFGERTLLPIWKYQVEKKSNI